MQTLGSILFLLGLLFMFSGGNSGWFILGLAMAIGGGVLFWRNSATKAYLDSHQDIDR